MTEIGYNCRSCHDRPAVYVEQSIHAAVNGNVEQAVGDSNYDAPQGFYGEALMNGKRASIRRTVLCLAQAGLLFYGSISPGVVSPALAASGFTGAELSRIDGFERTIFGDTRTNLSPEARLRTIETNLFGTVKKGSVESRLSGVQKALGLDKTGALAPPMAAQLDHVPHEQAPGNVASAPAEPASPAADLLQDAMNQYSTGDVATAEKTFKRVLTIDRNNPDAYYNLGVIYEGKGDLKNALENYQKASALNPSDSELKSAVASVRGKLDKNRQVQIAQQKKEQQQLRQQQQESQKRDNLRSTVEQASNDYKNGNFSEAARKLESVAKQAPNDPDVQYALGQAYKAKGDNQKARTAFNNASNIDPSNQLYKNALNELSNSSVASSAGGSSTGRSPQIDDSTPPGQITPFSGTGSSGSGFYGTGSVSDRGYYNGGMGGFRSSRLKRALAAGAVGAAAGALFSATSHSSIKSGALRGALMGGLVGYFTSRY